LAVLARTWNERCPSWPSSIRRSPRPSATCGLHGAWLRPDAGLEAILLPIGNQHLLVGALTPTIPTIDPEQVNVASVQLSRDFFVASRNTEREQRYQAGLEGSVHRSLVYPKCSHKSRWSFSATRSGRGARLLLAPIPLHCRNREFGVRVPCGDGSGWTLQSRQGGSWSTRERSAKEMIEPTR
jgi:hypothetical protein